MRNRKRTTRRSPSSPATHRRAETSRGNAVAMADWIGKNAQLPLLSHDEEIALARRIRAGDREALSKLVLSNTRLVAQFARRYEHPNVPAQDLIQEGNIGLLQAAERFDPDRGFRFSTYAVWWIRRAVLRALSYHSRPIRLPGHVVAGTSKLERATADLRRNLHRDPTVDELAAELAMKPEEVEFLQGVAYDYVSIDVEASASGGAGYTDVEDPRERPERWLRRLMVAEDVDRVLSVLPTREQAILRTRYGINDGRPRTLKETGERFDLTRERIRQIEKQALAQLREVWTRAADETLTETVA